MGEVEAALSVADLAVFVVSAVDGVEVQTEVVWRRCAELGVAPHGLRQQGGQGAGRLPPRAGPAARPRSALASRRSSCPSARRRPSTASPTCSRIRPSSTSPTASTTRSRMPSRTGGRGASRPRRAGRGDRLGRRRAAGALPVGRGADRSRSSSGRWPTRCSRAPSSPSARLGPDRRRHRPPGRLHLRDRSLARQTGRSTVRAGDQEVPVAADAVRPAAGLRLPDDRRSLRRPALAVQGPVGHHQDRRPPRERHAAAPTSGCTACSTCGARTRRPPPRWWPVTSAPWPSSASTHDRRHAGAQGLAGAGGGQPSRRRRCSSIAVRPRTQADDDKLGGALAAPPGRGSGAGRRAQRGDPPDPAPGRGRDPPVRLAGAAGPQVRRQRRHRGRPGALPGDDLRAGRGRGQGQEADRRARPVRGRQPAGGAARSAARASPSSTPSSAAPSPVSTSPPCSRGIEDTMATRWRARLPGGRREGAVLRRQVPQRRLLRDGLPHRGLGRLQGRAVQGRRRGARAGLAADRAGAGLVPGRRDGRHQLPPRAGAGHRTPTAASRRSPRSSRPRRSSATPSICAR